MEAFILAVIQLPFVWYFAVAERPRADWCWTEPRQSCSWWHCSLGVRLRADALMCATIALKPRGVAWSQQDQYGGSLLAAAQQSHTVDMYRHRNSNCSPPVASIFSTTHSQISLHANTVSVLPGDERNLLFSRVSTIIFDIQGSPITIYYCFSVKTFLQVFPCSVVSCGFERFNNTSTMTSK